MTFQYRIWMRSDEALWWVDVRAWIITATARILGAHVAEEPDEFVTDLLTENGNNNGKAVRLLSERRAPSEGQP